MEAEEYRGEVGMGRGLSANLNLFAIDVQGMKSGSVRLQGLRGGDRRHRAVGALTESQEDSPSGNQVSGPRVRLLMRRRVAEGSGRCLVATRVGWGGLASAPEN